jgi:Family of unknown function (DUF6311)
MSTQHGDDEGSASDVDGLSRYLSAMTADSYRCVEYAVLGLLAVMAVGLTALAMVNSRHRSTAVTALAGVIGAGYFTTIHGIRILDPREIYWLRGDSLNQFLGWHLFRREPWQLPPGVIRTLIYPTGTSIGNADALPIFALTFKFLDGILPIDFQFIGLWLLTAFVLQCVFAVLLMQTLTPHAPLQVAGAALIFLSPIMLYRLGHPALVGHWMLLAGLVLYLKAERDESVRKRLVLWTILLAIAAATHPYLTVMVFGLACAASARWLVERPDQRRFAFLALVIFGADVIGIWWICGYFTVRAGDLQSVGMEQFSTNLLSVVTPMGSSAFLPDLPVARDGQYEGFNYLGLGVIVLTAVAGGLLLRRRPSRAVVRSLLPLVSVTLLFWVFALSHQVTAGGRILFELPHQWWTPAAAFRATGRFAWPAHYVLVVLALAVAIRRLRPTTAMACLGGAFALQVVDLLPLQLDQRAYRRRPASYSATVPVLAGSYWHEIVPQYKHLVIWPSSVCAQPGLAAADRYEPFVYVAGRYRLTINDGWSARYDAASRARSCERIASELAKGSVDDDTVYVLRPDARTALFEMAREPLLCVDIRGVESCITLRSRVRWSSAHPEFEMSRLSDHAAETGTQLSSSEPDRTDAPAATVDDVIRLQERLDQVYRDVLKRSSRVTHVSNRETARGLHQYLSYRLMGCAHRGAVNRVHLASEGLRTPDCPAGTVRGALPPRNETVDFRRELEQARGATAAPESSTYVDLEGEAVWTQEYLSFRRRGCSANAALTAVLSTIEGNPAGAAKCQLAGSTSRGLSRYF